MNKQEAKRLVCACAAGELDNIGAAEWLVDGMSETDEARVQEAFDELCAELRRRGEKRA